jgi:hypothetical protein
LTLAFLLPLPLWKKYAPNPLAWVDSLFFPSEEGGVPPLNLGVARYAASASQWQRAADEYERVAGWHPRAPEVWLGWMEVAGHLPDPEAETQQVLAEGLHALKDPSAREALFAAFTKARDGMSAIDPSA